MLENYDHNLFKDNTKWTFFKVIIWLIVKTLMQFLVWAAGLNMAYSYSLLKIQMYKAYMSS